MSASPAVNRDKSRARALALAMHAIFILLIVFGVSWQRKPPATVQADLWSQLPPLPQTRPAPPPPPPAPPPPKPVPRVTPPPPPPKVERPVPKPDIALKKVEKEKKAEPKPQPKPQPKPEPRKVEDDKAARLQKEAKAKAQREAREREMQAALAEKEAKAAADKVAAEKAAAERAARAAEAQENQKYINGIWAKVWARVAVPPDLQGNPEAVFMVSLLPGGELQSVVMRKSSGNAAYDAAIERAIRQAQPFVVPSGDQFHRSFRNFPMSFRPKQ